MMHTPVSASPARIARSTGAAPRQRGSSEKCTFTKPSGSGVEQRDRQQLAERHDDAELGARRAHLVDDLAARSGVRTGSPSSLGGGLHRARVGARRAARAGGRAG